MINKSFKCRQSFGMYTVICYVAPSCQRQCYMHGNGSLIRLGQLKGTVTRLHNHHVKKANMMMVMSDLDQNLFPSTASLLLSVFINNIMSFNIDVGVTINDYYHLMGRGSGAFIKSSTVVI